MSNTRKHHYVSQFYLSRFVAPKTGASLLYVVDKPLQKLFSTSSVNVAQERDFHRIDVIEYETNNVEDALAQVEGQVATSLKAILMRGYVGDDDDANALFYYMALLFVKNPAMRSQINDVAHQVMTTIAKNEAADAAGFVAKLQAMIADGSMDPDTDVEGLRQSILRDDYKLFMARELHLDIEFKNAKELVRYFAGRRWVFLQAKEGQFVTSDRPVVLTRDCPGLLGLADLAVRILFPLSSGIAIMGGVELTAAAVPIERRVVAEINAKIAWNANRQIYARDETFEYVAADGDLKPA